MQCSLVRTNISVMVSIAVFKTHVLCPDSRGSMFLLNVGWYPNFTFQVNIGLTSLDNDQLDAHLLYFTIRPPQSSTCFEHYMLIIRRLNCIDAASGIVLSVSGHSVHMLRENCRAVLSQRPGRKWVTHPYLVLYAVVAFKGRTLRVVTDILADFLYHVLSSSNECRVVEWWAFLFYFLAIPG